MQSAFSFDLNELEAQPSLAAAAGPCVELDKATPTVDLAGVAEGSSAQATDPPTLEEASKLVAEDSAVDDMTCAICLEQIPLADTAIVKGCEHAYCVHCILRWAMQKETCSCPKCKAPFSYLFTYRSLDGTLHDFPLEESVCLLKRARWFEDHLKELEKGKSPCEPPALTSQASFTDDYSQFYEEYDDDDEVEAYYFSSAAGRARICLGNRRFGENGYISSGRMHARPIPARTPGKGKAAAEGGSSGSATPGSKQTSKQKAPAGATPSSIRSSKGSRPSLASNEDVDTPGSSGSKQGRRARRNAKRAAVDARQAVLF
ncbi:hypothetical protein WJX72_004388 [[Myrmecia] bisecta]|uniref:RING-type domain-containing protein n=1 Tax=[Myrmecia] bisecta TaxID=41462 RepID=A0AAW1QQW0_9CHLO